jgi:micrococcal nuclease
MKRFLAPSFLIFAIIGAVYLHISLHKNGSLQSFTASKFVDGDTVHGTYVPNVPVQVKLRLLNIDTPEVGEPLYHEAQKFLQFLAENGNLRIEYEKMGTQSYDKFGRLLVYLFSGDKNLNIEMVRAGFSRYYTKYGSGRFSNEFIKAENEAKEKELGIWKKD